MFDVAAYRAADWKGQNAMLEPHLLWVLEQLVQPMPTTHIAWALSERTGLDEKELFRPLLRRFAPHRPEWATQDGGESRSFGRTSVRWRWHPQVHGDLRGTQETLDDIL